MIEKKILITDCFFDYLNLFDNDWQKYKYFNVKEFNEETGREENWPGTRTKDLKEVDRPFMAYALTCIEKKFGNSWNNNQPYLVDASFQLRELGTPDWIHKDDPPHDYTCLVYLGDTNLKSGTTLYNDKHEEILHVPFLKNRAVLFSSKYWHKSTENFNGRYTLGLFFRLQ